MENVKDFRIALAGAGTVVKLTTLTVSLLVLLVLVVKRCVFGSIEPPDSSRRIHSVCRP